MGRFELFFKQDIDAGWEKDYIWWPPVRIPPAKELMGENQVAIDSGTYQGDFPTDGYGELIPYISDIHVYGVKLKITTILKDGGMELSWPIRGILQSAPTINGPWTDVTFNDSRRLFVRTSSPAEFFRIKPPDPPVVESPRPPYNQPSLPGYLRIKPSEPPVVEE